MNNINDKNQNINFNNDSKTEEIQENKEDDSVSSVSKKVLSSSGGDQKQLSKQGNNNILSKNRQFKLSNDKNFLKIGEWEKKDVWQRSGEDSFYYTATSGTFDNIITNSQKKIQKEYVTTQAIQKVLSNKKAKHLALDIKEAEGKQKVDKKYTLITPAYGPTLAEFIKPEKKDLTPLSALQIIEGIFAAENELHSLANYIHGNIKPDNFFIINKDEGVEVKLANFEKACKNHQKIYQDEEISPFYQMLPQENQQQIDSMKNSNLNLGQKQQNTSSIQGLNSNHEQPIPYSGNNRFVSPEYMCTKENDEFASALVILQVLTALVLQGKEKNDLIELAPEDKKTKADDNLIGLEKYMVEHKDFKIAYNPQSYKGIMAKKQKEKTGLNSQEKEKQAQALLQYINRLKAELLFLSPFKHRPDQTEDLFKLIIKMTNLDPKKRLSAEQAYFQYQHIKANLSESLNFQIDQVLTSLDKFISKHDNQQELATIQQTFYKLDGEKNFETDATGIYLKIQDGKQTMEDVNLTIDDESKLKEEAIKHKNQLLNNICQYENEEDKKKWDKALKTLCNQSLLNGLFGTVKNNFFMQANELGLLESFFDLKDNKEYNKGLKIKYDEKKIPIQFQVSRDENNKITNVRVLVEGYLNIVGTSDDGDDKIYKKQAVLGSLSFNLIPKGGEIEITDLTSKLRANNLIH